MAAVSVLLIVLIGGINTANYLASSHQTARLLEMLTENDGVFPQTGPEERKKEDDGRMGQPKRLMAFPPEDGRGLSEGYFTVRLNDAGEIIFCDVSHMMSMTEADAEEYAKEAEKSGKSCGSTDHLRWMAALSKNGDETIIAFADTSGQLRLELKVLFLSFLIGLFCWLLMFLLVYLLAERAIRPIAENMQRQKQFVTDAGHEIKTPLAIIMANTDALELHVGENRWSKNIRTQTERLSGLMQNLLMLSRMEEAETRISKSVFSLSDLTRRVIGSFSAPAESRGLRFVEDIGEDIMINAGKEQIEQLISILADNAVKYADEGGTIRISLERKDKMAVLRAENTLHMTPEEEPEKWFDRFYRGDSARTQKNGGYGVGLSAARAIVQAHKGAITAEYYKERQSVVFTVQLSCLSEKQTEQICKTADDEKYS